MAAGRVDLPAHWARLDGPAAGASVLVRALTLTLRCLRLGSTDIDGREPALPRRFPVQAPRAGYAASPALSALVSIVNSDMYASIAAAQFSRTCHSVQSAGCPI